MAVHSGDPQPRPQPQPVTAMPGALRLARVAGFAIYVHWSWLIIFWLLTWSLAVGYLPDVYPAWGAGQRWVVGAITSLLFFVSVLVHELAHSVLARRRGLPVHSITLFIFGGVSMLGGEARRAQDEFWIAIVGPLTSFAVAVVAFVVWLVARAAGAEVVRAVAGYLASINLSVGVFNLLPGFPLDGGRVLRSVVWGVRRSLLEATRVASNVGKGIAALLVALGIVMVFAGGIGGLWLVFIGWFLWNAAESSYQQLVMQRSFEGLSIGPVIERAVPRVAPDVSLRQLAHDYILKQNRRAFFVAPTDEGDIQGLITLSDLQKVPDEEWDRVSVYRAMTPRDRLITITPRTDALVALEIMAEHNIAQLVVVDGREPLGLLSRAALISAIQLRNAVRALEGQG
ncbi:MAG: peptidase [Chloroflexota bacterium]